MKYNGKPVSLTFKQLVKLISEIEVEDDKNEAFALIDWSYQHDKITWTDHEMLFTLTDKIQVRR